MRSLALVSVITVAIAGLKSNEHHRMTGQYNKQCESNIFDHAATISPKVIGIPLQYQAGFPGVLNEIFDNEEADKRTPSVTMFLQYDFALPYILANRLSNKMFIPSQTNLPK